MMVFSEYRYSSPVCVSSEVSVALTLRVPIGRKTRWCRCTFSVANATLNPDNFSSCTNALSRVMLVASMVTFLSSSAWPFKGEAARNWRLITMRSKTERLNLITKRICVE